MLPYELTFRIFSFLSRFKLANLMILSKNTREMIIDIFKSMVSNDIDAYKIDPINLQRGHRIHVIDDFKTLNEFPLEDSLDAIDVILNEMITYKLNSKGEVFYSLSGTDSYHLLSLDFKVKRLVRINMSRKKTSICSFLTVRDKDHLIHEIHFKNELGVETDHIKKCFKPKYVKFENDKYYTEFESNNDIKIYDKNDHSLIPIRVFNNNLKYVIHVKYFLYILTQEHELFRICFPVPVNAIMRVHCLDLRNIKAMDFEVNNIGKVIVWS